MLETEVKFPDIVCQILLSKFAASGKSRRPIYRRNIHYKKVTRASSIELVVLFRIIDPSKAEPMITYLMNESFIRFNESIVER